MVRLGSDGDTPKSGHHREVPIISSYLDRALRQAVARGGPTVARFANPREAVNRAALAAGLDTAPTRHELRHWFCSATLALGVSPPMVKMWMGHSSLSVTDRYADGLAATEELRAILDQLGPHQR